MESGYSVADKIPPGYTREFQPFLFNLPGHLNLQSSDWRSYYLLRKVNHRVLGEFTVHLDEGTAWSPKSAPFGSFEFSDQVSPRPLFDFVGECEGKLKKEGIRRIVVTDAPLFYRKSGELLQTILFNHGYHASRAELSSGIPVSHNPFEANIETWEKRKLKQSKEKGAQFKSLALDEIESVYNFLLQCRTQRGQSLSMSLKELVKVIETFPDRFHLFGIFIQKELAAASVAIQVHREILYNFYSGHLKKFDSISPVVALIGGMYKFSGSHHYRLLDLGTSAIDGLPNFGLLDFKLRLGAVPSMKLTFEKQLN